VSLRKAHAKADAADTFVKLPGGAGGYVRSAIWVTEDGRFNLWRLGSRWVLSSPHANSSQWLLTLGLHANQASFPTRRDAMAALELALG
jgi:hypothetical protein